MSTNKPYTEDVMLLLLTEQQSFKYTPNLTQKKHRNRLDKCSIFRLL